MWKEILESKIIRVEGLSSADLVTNVFISKEESQVLDPYNQDKAFQLPLKTGVQIVIKSKTFNEKYSVSFNTSLIVEDGVHWLPLFREAHSDSLVAFPDEVLSPRVLVLLHKKISLDIIHEGGERSEVGSNCEEDYMPEIKLCSSFIEHNLDDPFEESYEEQNEVLPWDHLESGLDKRWLAEDLQRALAATVVPDCSFEGCSSCGVCGPELGHNVVIPPPAIPAALPQRAPASDRVDRLRIGFAKTGSLALISHLDTLRMLERALRRSGLPVSFTGGFHPLPRLQLALPLPLGVEGSGEWLDLEFTEQVDPGLVRSRLQPELPPGFQLLSAIRVEVFGVSLSQELASAHWQFVLQPQAGAPPTPEQWQQARASLLAAETLIWNDTDKKGRPRSRDCRPFLLDLQWAEPQSDGSLLCTLWAAIDAAGRSLRPEQVQHWLAERLGQSLALSGLRRKDLVLKPC